MQAIPTPSDGYPHQTAQVQLGESFFTVTWHFNSRAGLWYFSLADIDGVAIVSGVRVVLNVDLLRGVSGARRPPGAIAVVDPSGRTAEPGLVDLGTRVKVVYIPPEELGV